MPNWLRGIFTHQPESAETTKIQDLKEAAIKIWEQDKENNPEGNKVVRGDDGLPVEILETKSASGLSYSMLLNGNKHKLPHGDDVINGYRELIPDLQKKSQAMTQFVVCGVKLFFDPDGVSRDNQFYVLFGRPLKKSEGVKKNYPSKEAAITAWENNNDGTNSDHNKAVRGDDGLPVEIINIQAESGLPFAILFNGQQRQIPGEKLTQGLPELINALQDESETMGSFVINGVKRLRYGQEKGQRFDILMGYPVEEVLPLIMNDGPIQ